VDVICRFTPPGLGWIQSLRDFRDYSPESPAIRQMLTALAVDDDSNGVAESVDLREYFPAVDNQLQLNSSTAHASVALVEYFVRRAKGRSWNRLGCFFTRPRAV
jgi:hypothetical protein